MNLKENLHAKSIQNTNNKNSKIVDKLIIMAAGVSSRMRNSDAPKGLSKELEEQANTEHKSMLKIGPNGEPFTQLQLKNAFDAGIKEIAFVVSETENSIKNFYGELSDKPEVYGLKLHFIPQKIHIGRTKPAGTADAVVQVLDALPDWQNETVLICNGDNLYSKNAFSLMNQDTTTNGMISYKPEGLGLDNETLTKYGILVEKDGYLDKIVEKPDLETLLDLKKNYGIGVSMSIYRLVMKDAGKYLRNVEFDEKADEKFLPTAVLNMVKDGYKIEVVSVNESIPDLTTKADILKVQESLKSFKM